MLEENEKNTFRFIAEKIHEKYYQGLEIEKEPWLFKYRNIPIHRRIEYWWIKIIRFEHRVGGEFNIESINEEATFLTNIIKEIDIKSEEVISGLYYKLINNGLQVEEISEYMAVKLKELI